MHSESGNVKIFAGKSGQSFAKKMCSYLNTELGNSEVIHFSDGNIFVRIRETVRNSDVYLVQPIGMDPNNEFVEILFWIDAFKRASASSVTVIVPYFGYAKGDKKDEPRVSIRARVCADCIEIAGADRFITMDLHAPQIQGFFRIPSDHLYSLPLLCESVKKYTSIDNLVVVSPDAGFAKTARKYADYLGTPVAIGDKTRVAHDENAKILELIGDVDGKDCLIVDDFSISGGTLIDIANVLKNKGAKRIIAALGHNILRESGVKRIDESPIELVISTDTVENPFLEASKKMITVSAAPLFAEAVSRIHNRVSVSPLFAKVPEKVLEELDK
ncbi:MAG: ribose-phosphate diphosphokinase [Clostridia bacterium]|nr:ribose-phosphate diphosphokinase [Clostridia bacterium]